MSVYFRRQLLLAAGRVSARKRKLGNRESSHRSILDNSPILPQSRLATTEIAASTLRPWMLLSSLGLTMARRGSGKYCRQLHLSPIPCVFLRHKTVKQSEEHVSRCKKENSK